MGALLKIGVIDLFGILMPGVVLLVNLWIACSLAGVGPTNPLHSLEARGFSLVGHAILFFCAYLTGIILRLFRPDPVDRFSTWVARKMRDQNELRTVRDFKYRTFAQQAFVVTLATPLLPTVEGRDWFNFLKLAIQEKSIPLAEEVHKAEALMRLLSGVFYASAVAAALYFLGTIVAGITQSPRWWLGLVGIGVSLVVAAPIVARFRDLRLKELDTVVAASCTLGILVATPQSPKPQPSPPPASPFSPDNRDLAEPAASASGTA
jgi:hypothetical protein